MNIRILLTTAALLTGLSASASADTTSVYFAENQIRKDAASLEHIGNDVTVSIELTILPEFKVKNESFARLTPIIQKNSFSKPLTPIIISSRRQNIIYKRQLEAEYLAKGIDPIYILREKGKELKVSYKVRIPFEEWMSPSDLAVDEDLCGCNGISSDRSDNIIGRLAAPFSPSPVMAFRTPDTEPVKHRADTASSFLDFPVNETIIYPEYRGNPAELYRIRQSIEVVKNDPNTIITAITIHGYASPEGPYDNNIRLARNRTEALKQYVCDLYSFDRSLIKTAYTPEDWRGLRRYVENSSLENKTDILQIIDSDLEPDAKNWKLQVFDGGKTYRHLLDEVYPALRHSDYAIWYTVRNFSVEEAREIIKKNPKLLSLNEMFLVANTYEKGSEEYKEVFEIAVVMFPDDSTANLNAACIAIEEGQLKKAARYLAKADSSPEAIHARGVLAMLEKAYILAEEFLLEAKEMGIEEAEENLKQLYKLTNN